MDRLDSEILFTVMRDGRISAREIARLLGVSHSVINYRIRRLFRSGIFRGFALYVSPVLIGFKVAYVKSENPINASYSVNIKLSRSRLYEVYQPPWHEVRRSVFKKKQETLTDVDLRILRELALDPRASQAEIVERVGGNEKVVRKRMDRILSSGMVKVVPLLAVSELPWKLRASLWSPTTTQLKVLISFGRRIALIEGDVQAGEQDLGEVEEYEVSALGLEGGAAPIDRWPDGKYEESIEDKRDWMEFQRAVKKI
ncbi:hypothetical protein HS1genome_1069 [Sulfodiicoccus acidiphilus]|uniref:HTH asnC-type domain-containing protein n=1 Tax=Sulfodiicoccus acidiphilus TaxID=1670455 RepID=A0A348B3C8_9CREN|nr:winged helix-turn-helix transcriptional regulator [Sulfodiicoccus acidiphilus]BBD72680.1 hypothetical protein HS1genome_1069 [Sulfodiicoccus acidiphilus]GGT95538.1 hypothetical protein GCM10007116_11370 [Sulfodiicoccus acidiphilus]